MESNMKSVLRNYMAKCSEGRGLEKFLRRNSFSSDERENSTPITTRSRNKTKSLESLTDTTRKGCCTSLFQEKPQEEQQEPKKKSVEKETNKSAEKQKPMESAKVVVKQSGEKLDKKKSQFNYESIIEITLPSAPAQQQTIQIADVPEKLEEPIKPIIHTPIKPKIPSHNNKNMSPTESYVSKQNPLEWDSFLPGFESSAHQNFQLCNPMELCENELAALKTYFQRCGLQLPNENLVVVIKNRQDSAADRDKQLSEIKRNKEKWQNIYEKYKEKYPQSATNEFSTPGAHSTPNVVESSLKKMNEKSSQTSLVRNTAKSTQVEGNRSSKECQVTQTTDQGTLNSKHCHELTDMYQNQSEVAESFEFIAGSLKQQQERKLSSPESSKHSEVSKQDSEMSEQSKSIKNDEISNFDDSLKVAIALLNSLLESRHMKPELKRNLAEKVIQKIVQIQTSRSIQTTSMSSGIYPLSNSSVPSEAVKSVKEVLVPEKDRKSSSSKSKDSSSKSRDEVLKDCFKPMTHSEVNYQNSLDEEPTKGSSRDQPKSQLMDYVKREKQSHLRRIEMEIEHLKNLRDLLKRNDTPISIEEGQPIYENLSLLLKKSKEHEEKVKMSEKLSKEKEVSEKAQTNNWNSHANVKKSAKNRSKLETPVLREQSLASFIDNKNRKFIERYEKHHKNYEDAHVYTRPYSGSKKQVDSRVIKSKHMKSQGTATKDVQTSTSLASSSVFESSDSISVPVNTNTKTSTTHQSEVFDKKRSSRKGSGAQLKIAETQTTDSICRTKPIFEAAPVNYGTTSTTVTQRVNRINNDKEQQTNAPSVRYTLTFDKTSRANVRSYMSLPQRGNSDYAISKSSKEIYNQISSSATLDNRHAEDKENYNSDDVLDEDDEIDLPSCLNKNRPEIFMRFEERKRCIAELKKLRALRNEHRKKLLLLTSDKSIEGKLLNNLPELPLRTTRMFSTKALKLQTQKKLQNLTEVQQKKKEENLKNLKRKNRLMTEIFNKNLQRNVLKGNLNLSNTVNLISK